VLAALDVASSPLWMPASSSICLHLDRAVSKVSYGAGVLQQDERVTSTVVELSRSGLDSASGGDPALAAAR